MHLKSGKPAPRVSREERRLQTRAALRESALREFAVRSVAGTSAERIAEAAGFTRGAFYAHFENKQALLLDLIGEHTLNEQAAWIELAEGPLDLELLLQRLDERTARYDPSGLWTMISAETFLHALRDPDFARQYREHHEATLRNFVGILDRVFTRAGKVPPVPLTELCEAMLTLSRTPQLPPTDHPDAVPQPVPGTLLFALVRGLLAIAQPQDP